jgi:glycosidase
VRLQREVPHHRWSPFVRNHDQTRTRTELGGDVRKARLAAILLLTQPGIPFVYYGEEIGMTGNKPDERLRTPMQWGAARGGGFTTGRAWQAAQPDSVTVTVAAQDRDPESLLNLHRQLIHLRVQYPALGSGTLTPVAASEGAVAAYVRRSGDQAMLVVVNLGDRALTGVSLAAPPGALPPGNWGALNLLDGPAGRPLRVAADGSVGGYIALRSLAPMTGHVFALVAPRR